MPSQATGQILGDRPLTELDHDRLGFGSIASGLAASISAQATPDGLVVGIEGPWGSGKSSILGFVADYLHTHDPIVSTVRFEPWLVGDRDALVAELMNSLADAIEVAEGETKGQFAQVGINTVSLAKQIRAYGAGVAKRAAPIASFAALMGIPLAGLVGEALAKGGEALAALETGKSLLATKAAVVGALHRLSRPIVVLVDDLDRLDPLEAAEMMRVIRAVADFPNIIYVLCYDRTVLARSLQVALNVEDGDLFLQKIVQVSFRLPKPEEFDLRRWLYDELIELYGPAISSFSNEVSQDLRSVCNTAGAVLETPRDVVHAVNAVRLAYVPVKDKVHFPDLVWLQLVRLKDKELYDWIEAYMVIIGALAGGAHLATSEKQNFERTFDKLVDTGDTFKPRSIHVLEELLPGVKPDFSFANEEKKFLFNDLRSSSHERFHGRRRLEVESQYRYYFAFAKPAGALDDAEISAFLASASSQTIVERTPGGRAAGAAPRRHDGRRLAHRLAVVPVDRLSADAAFSILAALSNVMDDVGASGGETDFGRYPSWESAIRAFRHLIHRVTGPGTKNYFVAFSAKAFL